ncbi:carbohydrate sulfotransferase 1-like [Mercenaria mercenaria]|uniref:carbohydrate sulfotransferase 1-like n=1 Tax=Mercenaria mercenaria TaxID=6596 RepID=UPI00234E851E|nr:carbohydrate sulfotransferase 1-like [Mercenaria mercenaria]
MILRKRKTKLYTGLSFFILLFVINRLSLTFHGYSHGPVQVLILTYMRSGSSLTGDILQHSQGSFYVFEPLRSLCPHNCSSIILRNLVYANGSKRTTPISFNKTSYSILHNWFNCSITELPSVGLLDVFLDKGWKTQLFFPCYVGFILKTMNHSYAIEECARQLGDICERSPIRIVKTIRARLNYVKYLLDDFPNLKIIHVVRDPRATLWSQSHFHMCLADGGGRYRCSKNLCGRMEDDIAESHRLSKTYPNRIMTLKYEDLAKQPIEISQKMYDFISVPMTSETKMYVYNKTKAGNKNDCEICSTRANSSAHIDYWKHFIDPDFLDIINTRCDFVLRHFQYDEYTINKSSNATLRFLPAS